MYPDANFTLRVTFGHVAGYVSRGKTVPFTTRLGDMFTLARSRGNKGEFKLPPHAAGVANEGGRDRVPREDTPACRSISSRPTTSPAATRAARP